MDLVSPRPFWPLKDGLPANYPPLREDIACDVVVLGAGISGALVAQSLARSGFDVVVVDRRDAASGSTSASTALLQYEIDLPLTELIERTGRRDAERAYRLCHESIDKIERLVREIGADCVFQRRKSVYFASKSSEAESLRKECVARQSAGIAVEYWSEREVSAHFSFTRPAALVSQQGAELDCYKLTFALLEGAKADGARVFDRTPMDGIESDSAGVRLKTDRGRVVRARHAIFACGYESQSYLPRRIVRLKSTYALASEPLDAFPGWWERCLIWETARPYVYLRTTSDGRAIIGGEDDPFRDPARRDRLVDKKTDRLAEKFRGLFPGIELDIGFRWAGTFGETKDGLAYIGGVRQMPRCFFALGFGGNGITYSVIAADILRDLLLGKANDDTRLFRFDR
jgi:glycine/D-amino acid oxidase-like deaminating enzyme